MGIMCDKYWVSKLVNDKLKVDNNINNIGKIWFGI